MEVQLLSPCSPPPLFKSHYQPNIYQLLSLSLYLQLTLFTCSNTIYGGPSVFQSLSFVQIPLPAVIIIYLHFSLTPYPQLTSFTCSNLGSYSCLCHNTACIQYIFVHYIIDSCIILITVPISTSYPFLVIHSMPDLSYPYMLLPISITNH